MVWGVGWYVVEGEGDMFGGEAVFRFLGKVEQGRLTRFFAFFD